MSEVPDETPVTTPVVPIVAIEGVDELQVPPVVVDESAVVLPTHMANVPVMAAGKFTTVSAFVFAHPFVSVYVMLVDPPAIAVTLPERLPTVATPALLLVQTPPVGVLVKVSADPAQRLVLPVIADGAVFTVITVVL
jgi:hypothetical protein